MSLPLVVEMQWQPEQWEQRLGRKEERQLTYAAVAQLEHLQSPWLVAAGRARLVLPECGRPVGTDGRDNARVLATDAGAEPPREDVVATGQPQVVRRHGLRRVLVDEFGQRVDVIGLERLDVADEQRALVLAEVRDRSAGLVGRLLERGAGALQCTVDAGGRRVEQLGALGRLPLQHFAEDQRRAL